MVRKREEPYITENFKRLFEHAGRDYRLDARAGGAQTIFSYLWGHPFSDLHNIDSRTEHKKYMSTGFFDSAQNKHAHRRISIKESYASDPHKSPHAPSPNSHRPFSPPPL